MRFPVQPASNHTDFCEGLSHETHLIHLVNQVYFASKTPRTCNIYTKMPLRPQVFPNTVRKGFPSITPQFHHEIPHIGTVLRYILNIQKNGLKLALIPTLASKTPCTCHMYTKMPFVHPIFPGQKQICGTS